MNWAGSLPKGVSKEKTDESSGSSKNPKYAKKANVKKNLAKVFSTVQKNPELIHDVIDFVAITDVTKLTNLVAGLKGMRAELASLGGSYAIGGASNLIRNGLLEELINIDPETLNTIFRNAAKNENLFKLLQENKIKGIDKKFIASEVSGLSSNALQLIQEMSKKDEEFIGKFSTNLANLIELRKKIAKAEKAPAEKIKELQLAEVGYIQKLSDDFIGALSKADPELKNKYLGEIVSEFSDLVIAKAKEFEQTRAIQNENEINIAKLFFDINQAATVKKGSNLSEVAKESLPLLEQVVASKELGSMAKHAINYALIVENKQENFNQIVKSGLALANNKHFLETALKEKIIALPGKVESSPDFFTKLPKELFKEEVVEIALNEKNILSIAEKVLEIDKFYQMTNIKKSDANKIKNILPEGLNYIRPIAKLALKQEGVLVNLITKSRYFNIGKGENPAKDVRDFLNQKEIFNSIFEKEKVSSIATKLEQPQEVIAIIPETLDYFRNISEKIVDSEETIKALLEIGKDLNKESFALVTESISKSGVLDKIFDHNKLQAIVQIYGRTSLVSELRKFLLNQEPETKLVLEQAFSNNLLNADSIRLIAENIGNPGAIKQIISNGITDERLIKAINQITDEQLKEFAKKAKQFFGVRELLPDASEYIKNVSGKILSENTELYNILKSGMEYTRNKNQENLNSLVDAFNNIAKNEKIVSAFIDDVNLDKMIKKTSIFKDELNDFKNATKGLIPRIASIVAISNQNLSNNKNINEIVARIQANIETFKADKKVNIIEDVGKLIKEVANETGLQESFANEIKKDRQNLEEIFDQYLSSLKKNNVGLKLLKPLGINGHFMVKVIEKINNPNALEAMSKFVENQSLGNALNLLKESKSRGFIVGHICKSIGSYFLAPARKIDSKQTLKIQESWVSKVAPLNNKLPLKPERVR